MNRERIQALIDVLKKVPDEKFDIKNWSCGTTACAIGWGIRLGAMPGWRLRPGGFNGDKFVPIDPQGHEADSDDIAAWFDIDWRTAERWFFPDSYPTYPVRVQHVIDRIEAGLTGLRA